MCLQTVGLATKRCFNTWSSFMDLNARFLIPSSSANGAYAARDNSAWLHYLMTASLDDAISVLFHTISTYMHGGGM